MIAPYCGCKVKFRSAELEARRVFTDSQLGRTYIVWDKKGSMAKLCHKDSHGDSEWYFDVPIDELEWVAR